MSTINTAFQPMTPTYVCDNTAAVQVKEAQQAGANVFRIRATLAHGYISWGPTSAVVNQGAPGLGSPKANTIGVDVNQQVYLELPAGTWFIGDTALATNGFEITAGSGNGGH